MVYKFDPVYFDSTIFELDLTTGMGRGSMQFISQNLPTPASYFPKTLVFNKASAKLPDIFHMSRGIIIFSERARVVMEHWAPGQVEFIPVTCQAKPVVAATLSFDSAYYFVNVLGRAQRLLWREMSTRKYPPREDGTELFGLIHDFRKWKLRERTAEEPLIWHDTPWLDGNSEYLGQDEVLVDDVLWRKLDEEFPEQLHAMRAGED
jgi:hypothetical protein